MKHINSRIRTLMNLLVVFGALVAAIKRHGMSPLLWLDTLNDNNLIHECLSHANCVTNGAHVSFGSLLQGASWHQTRAFVEWLGLGIQGAHWLATIMDALALVLVYKFAQRLTNLWTAFITVLLLLLLMDTTGRFADILWNFSPLLLAGTLSTALSITINKTEKLSVAVLGGVLVSMGSNIHLVCSLLLPGMLVSALFRKKGKIIGFLGISVGFVGTSLLTSPEAWFSNFGTIVGGKLIPGQTMLQHHADLVTLPFVIGIVGLALSLVLSIAKKGSMRRLGIILTWLVLPVLVLFIFGSIFLDLVKTNRYFLPFLPAFSLSVGISLSILLENSSLTVMRKSRFMERLKDYSPALLMLVLILVPAPTHDYDQQELRFSHVRTMARELKNLGWTFEQAMMGLKGPKDYLLLEAMRPQWDSPLAGDVTRKAENSTHENLIVLKAPKNLPEHLPSGCHIIDDPNGDLLIIMNRSYLDWSKFEVCRKPADDSKDWKCEATGLLAEFSISPDVCFLLRGFPKMPLKNPTRLRLRIPINCSGNQPESLLMPRFPGLCYGEFTSGKLTSVPNNSNNKENNEAQIVCPSREERQQDLTIEYNLASKQCPVYNYSGFPPFFFEVTPKQAQFIKRYFIARNKGKQP